MNPVQIIATLRKFGNYLAGLFPVLVTIAEFFSSFGRKLFEHPIVAPWFSKLAKNQFARSVWKVIERFYWRTYSKDRLDRTESMPESLPVLRPVFQLCALLCILIPFTQVSAHQLKIETFSGFTGTAPAWSIILSVLGLSAAWASLLVGTAMCNRIAFSVCSVAATYFLTTCVILLPRSGFNALLPFSVLLALSFCERNFARQGRDNLLFAIVNSMVVGIAAGIQLTLLTPIKPLLQDHIPLAGPVIGIGGGAVIGTFLGLTTLGWARLPTHPLRAFLLRGAPIDMKVPLWTIVFLLSLYIISGTDRGSLDQIGGMLISSVSLSTNYLWPIWYFIGVGVLHKLMGSSKVVAGAFEGMVSPLILKPLLLLCLIASFLIAISEKACVFLSTSTGFVPETLFRLFLPLYQLSKPYIWKNPFNTMTIHWFSWILLLDLIIVVVLAFQRRVTSKALIRLLFLSCFAALLISEYVFQLSSFTRSPTHSVIALFLFAIWLLWLMQTVGLNLSTRRSPMWPSDGRLAVYGGIVTLAMVEIFARSACRDFNLMNELFLIMFRGVIDVGLPYYLLVWTSRKVKDLPARTSTLLMFFCSGALIALCLNVAEKLAGVGWSLPALTSLVQAQVEQLRTTGSINYDLHIPANWYIVRSILYVSTLTGLVFLIRKKLGATTNSTKTALCMTMALASGIAAFSKTFVELPLPVELRALTAPLWQELTFNCNVVQTLLSYWIPALLIGLAQLTDQVRKTKHLLLAALLAVSTHFIISFGYGEGELFLRSSGVLYVLITMTVGLVGVLVTFALICLDSEKANDSDARSETDRVLLTPRSVTVLILIMEIVLFPFAIKQFDFHIDKISSTSILSHDVFVTRSWLRLQNSDPQSISFQRKNSDGTSILQIGTVPAIPKETSELLKALVKAARESGRFPNLVVVSVQSWNRYYPGALACNFSYELPTKSLPLTMAGLSVLLPRSDGRAEYFTLYTSPSTIEQEQWEIAYLISKTRFGRTRTDNQPQSGSNRLDHARTLLKAQHRP